MLFVRIALFFVVLACASLSHASRFEPASSAGHSREALLGSVLETVVRTSPEDRRDTSLRALRYLKDPDLNPFFGQLVGRRDPLLRAHGIFALAEMDESGMVNTHLLAKIEDPAEQAALIGLSISLGFLDGPRIDEILKWSSITPIVEVMLLGTLGERIAQPEIRARIERITSSESERAALLADVLLVHLDQDATRIASIVEQLRPIDLIDDP